MMRGGGIPNVHGSSRGLVTTYSAPGLKNNQLKCFTTIHTKYYMRKFMHEIGVPYTGLGADIENSLYQLNSYKNMNDGRLQPVGFIMLVKLFIS